MARKSALTRWNEAPSILGVAELAELLDEKTNTLYQRLYRGKGITQPRWRLACGPIWAKDQFKAPKGAKQ